IEREVAKSRMEKPVKVRARRLSGIPLSTSHHIDNATYSRGKTDYRSEISRNLLIGGLDGGRGGIRTPDTLSGMPVFKTGAINHSATLPLESMINDRMRRRLPTLPIRYNTRRQSGGQRGTGFPSVAGPLTNCAAYNQSHPKGGSRGCPPAKAAGRSSSSRCK